MRGFFVHLHKRIVMKKKELAVFNVINWDFNRDKIEHYDVLPHFRRCFERRKKDSKKKGVDQNDRYFKVPKTFEDFKEFVKDESLFHFWARCEYETIVHGWPVKRSDYKLDVHEQVMMNLDIVARILFEELGEKD